MGPLRRTCILLLAVIAFGLRQVPVAQAQRVFGQNKVVYEGRERLVFKDGMLEV